MEERELCYICIFLLFTLLNSEREKNLLGKCIYLIPYFYYKFVFIMFVNAFTMSIKKYANQFNRKKLIQNSFSESITITMVINLISSFLEKKIKIIRKIIRKNQFKKKRGRRILGVCKLCHNQGFFNEFYIR